MAYRNTVRISISHVFFTDKPLTRDERAELLQAMSTYPLDDEGILDSVDLDMYDSTAGISTTYDPATLEVTEEPVNREQLPLPFPHNGVACKQKEAQVTALQYVGTPACTLALAEFVAVAGHSMVSAVDHDSTLLISGLTDRPLLPGHWVVLTPNKRLAVYSAAEFAEMFEPAR